MSQLKWQVLITPLHYLGLGWLKPVGKLQYREAIDSSVRHRGMNFQIEAYGGKNRMKINSRIKSHLNPK